MSAWGNSWGVAWADSWGGEVQSPQPTGGAPVSSRRNTARQQQPAFDYQQLVVAARMVAQETGEDGFDAVAQVTRTRPNNLRAKKLLLLTL